MAKNLGSIDIENNDTLLLANNLGTLQGTYVGTGIIENLFNGFSTDKQDYYSFQLGGTAPINSYIELNSPDVVNIQATYKIFLYKYDPASDSYKDVSSSYQLPNYPYTYRIDLTNLTAGKYVIGVTGAEWLFGNATGLYELRLSVPSPNLPGKIINGTDADNTLNGTSQEDTINGLAGNDILRGYAGDDILNGGDGNDTLTGGLNSDILNGGTGTDLVYESGNLAKFILTNTKLLAYDIDILNGIEQAKLVGGAGENLIDASQFTLGSVFLSGGGDDDTLLGGSGADRLSGDDGFDYLDGGAGADTLIGGSGGDVYVIDNIGDIVTETGVSDYDEVRSFISYTLGSKLEVLTLQGTAAINGTGNSLTNTITGNSGNNQLIGLGGDDVLDGGKGVDTLIGGTGSDTYIVDRSTDAIIEDNTTGLELVKSSATQYTLGANLENLLLIGTGLKGYGNSLDNTLTGNGLGNTLAGGSGSDILYGDYGDDTLQGDSGNDYLYGGFDNDTVLGGSGDDYIDGQLGDDKLNGGAGQDTFHDWSGNNTYIFQFGQSQVGKEDYIDGFTFGQDKIDLLSSTGGALAKPVAFTRAADKQDYLVIQELVNQVFIDADGKTAGKQPLAVNSAALISAGGFSDYVIINDATPGFQANSDLVIQLGTFGDLPPLGVISVDTLFV